MDNLELQTFRRFIDSGRTKLTPKTISYEQDERVLSGKEARRQRHSYFRFKQPLCHDEIAGNSWDSVHLDSFMQQSRYVSDRFSSPRRTLCNFNGPRDKSEHYFRTTLQNKNTSHIGFTADNPLISNSGVAKESADKIQERLYQSEERRAPDHSQYKYISQEVKFRKTNPLTFQEVSKEPSKHIRYQKIRLRNLIDKRYPKGMLGVDNPERSGSTFYDRPSKSLKVRQEPHTNDSYVLDAAWTSKHRAQPKVSPYIEPVLFDPLASTRRFRNISSCNYNILTNRT